MRAGCFSRVGPACVAAGAAACVLARFRRERPDDDEPAITGLDGTELSRPDPARRHRLAGVLAWRQTSSIGLGAKPHKNMVDRHGDGPQFGFAGARLRRPHRRLGVGKPGLDGAEDTRDLFSWFATRSDVRIP